MGSATATRVERTVNYRLRLVDNISPTAKDGVAAEEELDGAIKKTTNTFGDQAMAMVYNITVLSAMREGLNGIVTELQILGITNDETHEKLMKFAAGVALFIDLARTIKGVIGMVQLLKDSTIALAAVETYRKVLNNPAAVALVATATGLAGGLGGYMYGRYGNKNEVNQTVVFNQGAPDSAGARSARRETLEGMGGF